MHLPDFHPVSICKITTRTKTTTRTTRNIMKYLISALIAFSVLAFAGCGQKNAVPASAAPKFADASVNTYITDFTQACNDAIAAYKAKDVMKIATVVPKATELYNKGASYYNTLKGDDVQKFKDWQSKLWTMVTDAASSMTSKK